MTHDIVGGIVEGLVSPRTAMRRVLDTKPGIDVMLGLVVLSYAIQGMAGILVPGTRTGDEPVLLLHLNLLISQLVIFVVTSSAVFGVGRVFGGTGGLDRSLAGVAWYSFVTSWLSPAALYGLGQAAGEDAQPGALSSLLLLGATGIGLWVFAGCVAEVHGFRSTWGVLGASLGVMLLAVASLLMLLPAPS